MIPKTYNLECYYNTDWGLNLEVLDAQEEAVDLSIFDNIRLNIFTLTNQLDPEYAIEAVINGNDMQFALTPEQTQELYWKVFFYELAVTLADSTYTVWLNGRFICRNVPNTSSQSDLTITLDADQTTVLNLEGVVTIARAVQAKVDAEAAATNAATSEGNASDSADSASNSATTATEQAGIATAKASEASASATTAEQSANVKDRDRSHFLPLHAKIGWQDDNGQFWHITAADLIQFIQDVMTYPTAPVWVSWDGSADPTMTVEPFNI